MSISFKQFLTEAGEPEVSLTIHFAPGESKFKILTTEKDERRDELEAAISQLGFKVDVNYFGADAIELSVLMLKEEFYTDPVKIQAFINEIKQYCELHFGSSKRPIINDESSWSILKFTTLPSKLVVWDYIEVAPHITKSISLSGIYKVLQPKETLLIAHLHAIDDSILGLFKFDKEIDIYLNGNSTWSTIVRKYLKTRDIAKCQTELMKNGLKQYAKL
jgi:hypothetical protein